VAYGGADEHEIPEGALGEIGMHAAIQAGGRGGRKRKLRTGGDSRVCALAADADSLC
jgi:hypothetical protein